MTIIRSLKKTYLLPPCVIALGNFDGVHKGHQEVIKKAVYLAKERNLASAVFTFSNLPINEISGRQTVKNIMSIDEKIDAIEDLGVDYLVCVDFDSDIQSTRPENFAGYILSGLMNCKAAVCGFNYSFGVNGSGRAEDLKEYGHRFGFDTIILDGFKLDGQMISSSLIRKLLDDGNVKAFEKFTGRRYSIEGKVSEGQHLGTRMGYPTVNLHLDDFKALPKNGVYVTNVKLGDISYKSITNVGNKPTVGKFDKNAETHIFDFDGDLYGENIKIEFIDFIREERKFENIEELEKQIAKDCENALHFNQYVV